MGVLSSEERDALTRTLARRWRLWDLHRVKETLSEASRTFNPGYTDTYLLYEALTHEFSEAEDAAGSRPELMEHVERMARRLESTYAVALRDSRNRSEFDAMVAEMQRTIRGRQ